MCQQDPPNLYACSPSCGHLSYTPPAGRPLAVALGRFQNIGKH